VHDSRLLQSIRRTAESRAGEESPAALKDARSAWQHVRFANSGGLVFMDESAEQVAAVWAVESSMRRSA